MKQCSKLKGSLLVSMSASLGAVYLSILLIAVHSFLAGGDSDEREELWCVCVCLCACVCLYWGGVCVCACMRIVRGCVRSACVSLFRVLPRTVIAPTYNRSHPHPHQPWPPLTRSPTTGQWSCRYYRRPSGPVRLHLLPAMLS